MFAIAPNKVVAVLAVWQAMLFQVCTASVALEENQSDSHIDLPQRQIVKLHRQRVPVSGEGSSLTYKSVYFGSIFMGHPERQEFSVVFDTGSGYVIVPSSMCKSVTCKIHRRYDITKSESAVDVDYDGKIVKRGAPRDQITLTFGTGEVVGQFADEWLCLSSGSSSNNSDPKVNAGEEANPDQRHDKNAVQAEVDVRGNALLQKNPKLLHNKTVYDHAAWGTSIGPDCMTVRLVMATEMTQEPFAAFSFDGVLGLGLDSLALVSEFSFFSMMVSQNLVSEPAFGIFLSESDDDFSEISFGGHNPRRLQSKLTHVPVVMPELGYWEVKIMSVSVAGKKLDFCDDGTCRAVVDTGTSLLAVPRGFAGTLQGELKGHIADPPADSPGCQDATGPEIHFEVEAEDFVLVLTAGDYTRQAHSVEEHLNAQRNAGKDQADSVMMQKEVDLLDSLGFSLAATGGRIATRETLLIQQGEETTQHDDQEHTNDDEDDDEDDDDNDDDDEDHEDDEGDDYGEDEDHRQPSAEEEVADQQEPPPEVSTIDQWQMDHSKCRPALMAIDFPPPLGPKLFIWGEPVLRKYYTEYNWKEKTIGFGRAYHPSRDGDEGATEFV